MHRPLLFLTGILIVLLILGYPFLSAKFGVSDFRIFPVNSENREFFDTYSQKFKESELTPISIVVKTQNQTILSKRNISRLLRFG